ncbi:MAG: holo-ACP synthase [Halioglobus sp.]
MIAIGTDILQIERIESVLERQGLRFVQRILTPDELEEFGVSQQPARFLAKRFAAKEAIAKALGTGIGRGVSWQHMQIEHDDFGAPQVVLTEGAKRVAAEKGAATVALSLADEKDYVVAFAVLSD